jgi:predicted metal-binding membrane protein
MHDMAMQDMVMPGGWTMSAMWMRMPDQTWAGAAAAFVGMWAAMMLAMMLPSVAPALWRYRRALERRGDMHPDGRVALAAIAYFSVWTLLGIIVFPMGAALAAAAMQMPVVARLVPTATALIVAIAGALQFTAWKAHRLACCRGEMALEAASNAGAVDAWRHGMRLGVDCAACCGGLTAILLVVGVMDLRAMVAVTAAITLERLAPGGERIARTTGAIAIGAGLLLMFA